jgi:putative FmdB family regulatory protein
MPIYEFDCAACGERFDELAKLDETRPCPRCGGSDVERRVSPVSTLRIGPRGGDARRSEARRRDRRERSAEQRRRESG